MTTEKTGKAYARAGVDIALADRLLEQVKPHLRKAVRPESLGSIGGFGGFFDISRHRCRHPVLVSSTDSVGTKVTAARLCNRWSGLGADIVNHCANDIAVCGAEPLYFLDYYATGRLGDTYVPLLKGLARACREARIALVGGETAELPGVYAAGECDLVGTIVGLVDKPNILTGDSIRPGDALLGLASSGLHTNGYSLARKRLFQEFGLGPEDPLPGFRQKVGTALMKPHLNYSRFLMEALRTGNRGKRADRRRDNTVFGAAHITGGGITGNLPRILPPNCGAVVRTASWTPLPIFRALTAGQAVSFEEAYEVFNMGIGLVLVAEATAVPGIIRLAAQKGHKARLIGEIVAGNRDVHLEG